MNYRKKRTWVQTVKRQKLEEPTKEANEVEMECNEAGFFGSPDGWFYESEFSTLITFISHEGIKDRYFRMYDNICIHEEILKDEVLMEAYMEACRLNMNHLKGKVVLDVGCGTGILSIFAARAGARHVYAVENNNMADYAKQIVRCNGFANRITVIKGKMEAVKLPVKKVDIIISDWMGSFLLFGSMLDTILFARDKYLAYNGLLLPSRAILYLAAIEDSKYKQEKFGFWESVHGIDMSCLRDAALSEVLIDRMTPDLIMSSIDNVMEYDLYGVTDQALEFQNEFTLNITRNDNIYALAGWFSVGFNTSAQSVIINTSPFDAPTHWKQATMYLPEVIPAIKGAVFTGVLSVSKGKSDHRSLNIGLKYCYKDTVKTVSGKKMYKLRSCHSV